MTDCFHPNPLQHGGSSQEMRLVPALKPEAAPIDGRSVADLILFMEKYGELLNYYDETNALNGHWKNFISQDLSTILAAIAKTDYNGSLETFYRHFNKIQNGDPDPEQHLKVLFDIPFTLADQIRQWLDRLVLNTSMREMIYQEVTGKLASDFRNLLLYYLASGNEGYVDTTFTLSAGPGEFQPRDTETILNQNFRQEWWVKTDPSDSITSWNEYKGTYLAPEVSSVTIFGDPGWTDLARMQYAVSFVRNIFTRVYNCFVRIISFADKSFTESLRNYPSHLPHNGVMLAFLRLFKIAQDELNQFTDRHLNFYYRDTLRILRKPANPDSAHVVFTIAKNSPFHTLDKGTELQAGKDATGRSLIYRTTDAITVNQGKIAELKSIFLDKNPLLGGVYAAEVSNSADGLGASLPDVDPSWFAFGSEQGLLSEEARSMTEADLGFLVASPLLRLSEGERRITIEMTVESFGPATFSAGELAGKLDLFLTGENGWIAVNTITGSNLAQANAIRIDVPAKKITIKFVVDGGAEPIMDFNPEIHKAGYSTEVPVLKCLLKQSNNISLYEKLVNVSISQINISVTVVNAVSCILHCDQGSIDNKNPFMPFGPRPKKGSAFFFGSHEVFSKKVTSLKLNLEWLGTPADASFYDHYLYKKPASGGSKGPGSNGNINYIGLSDNAAAHSFSISGKVKDGDEKINNPVPSYLFDSGDKQTIDQSQQLTFNNLFTDSAPNLQEFDSYDPVLRRGFVKITLTNPPKAFGHDVFTKVYTEQIIAVNKDSANNTLPNEPYTPLLQPLTYSYTAQDVILTGVQNDSTKGQFFHLFPFGFAEQNTVSNPEMVPPFKHKTKNGALIPLQGALHIGIEEIMVGQILNLYLEFSEGSEDAALDPAGVLWSYMRNNEWIPLDDFILADTTNEFLGSGIVKILIPEDMNDDNTIMPSSQRWIRIGVPSSYKAYPKVFALYTNAVKAVFADNENDPNRLAFPLPAGKITKLEDSNSNIKGVTQPFDSFDGRPTEQNNHYYVRVSERLRHKNRAITIWDYEKLILEEFGFLYKVKCLNHTNDETETAPGHVRIIVIPDMNKKSTGNLFEPRISNNKRQSIKKYITALNCPFAEVQIQNPQYEAIRIKCEVKIHEGLDETDHIKRLMTDLDKFLAPWAFEEGRGIDFGGTMHRSQIIYYMEKLAYVDYVTDFTLDLFVNNIAVKTNVDEVKATTSKSILTTYRLHQIGTNTCAS